MQETATIEPGLIGNLRLAVSWLTLLVIGVGLTYAALQLRSMEKARRSQALLHFLEVWDSAEMIESRRLTNDYKEDTLAGAIERAEELNTLNYFRLTMVADFFEDLGYALTKDYVTLEDIKEEFEPSVIHYYGLYKAHINNLQGQYKRAYKNFSDLASKLQE